MSAVGAATVIAPAAASGTGATTTLVSRATGVAGAKGDALSRRPTISADGRFVVFESQATNLDPADTDALSDIYLRDLSAGTTALVSRATGVPGAKGNASAVDPAISADGHRVAFSTGASNLDPLDGDAFNDIYVRDLATSTTTLVSRATGPTGAKGTGNSGNVAISGDGARVLFTTDAALDAVDLDTRPDAYVRDLADGTTTLVSRATGVAGAKAVSAIGTGISDDGGVVAFSTVGVGLDPADFDSVPDVYVRDLDASTTALASRATGPAGAKSDGRSGGGELSADGRRIVFESAGSNLDPADTDAVADVFVRDLTAATTTLLSRATGADGQKGDGESTKADISADGTIVAFASASTNLDAADVDTTVDVFVRDLVSGATTLVSRASAAGAKGNDTSGHLGIALSSSGRGVVFDSLASNLDPADTDGLPDVFVRTLATVATLEVSGVDPPTLRRGSTTRLVVTGTGFVPTSEVSFGPGVTVESLTFASSTRLEVTVAVSRLVDLGPSQVIVTNPTGEVASGPPVVVVACAQPHADEPPGSSGHRPACGRKPSVPAAAGGS